MKLFLSIAVSVIMHVSFLYSIKDKSIISEQESHNQQAQQQKDTTQTNNDSKSGNNIIWIDQNKGAGKSVPCKQYDGIGIQYNLITGIITDVAAGSPAEKSDLQVGDEIITPVWNQIFTYGEEREIIIARKGEYITKYVKIDKVCSYETN